MLMNNCGEPIHRQVIDNGLLPILVKIVKKKVTSFFAEYWITVVKLLLIDVDRILSWFQTELPVRENIFLLLDATQTSLGGAKARFPQYYDAYYELVVGIIFSIFLSFLLCYCVENSVSVISVCRYMD